MQGILDFLLGLGSAIWSLIKLLLTSIDDLLYVIGLLLNLLTQLPNLIGWLPSACIGLTITLFGIVVIYKIMGREG